MADPAGRPHAIARRAGRYSAATLISRLLGYARDACVAHFFGGAHLTDAFYTAFRISNLLRRMLGEGALAGSFVPVFSRSLVTDAREASRGFFHALFTSLAAAAFAATALGILFAPQITLWIAPGFQAQPEKFALTVLLTRWTFPFFFFITLAALCAGVLNSLRRFFLPALAPAMLSVMEILYMLALLRHFPPEKQIVGLAAAVAAGGAAHFLVQLPALVKEGFAPRWRWQWRHPRSLEVAALMGPAAIGLSVDQINAFVDTICATFLAGGSVTALYNSNRIMQLPLALFGIAVATVSLPALAEHLAAKDLKLFGRTLGQSLRMVVYIVTPAAVGLMVLSFPIVGFLFEHGAFTRAATALTAQALIGYCAGLPAYSSVKVLANSFYALGEPKVPVRVGAASMLLNVALNLLLMGPLGVGGLALATALASWLNAVWLFLLARRRLGAEVFPVLPIWATAWKSLAASVVMALVLAVWLRLDLAVHWQVLAGVPLGAAVFLAASHFLRIQETSSLLFAAGLKTGTLED